MKRGAEEALAQQQHEFCQVVWVKLDPALSIISAMQESMEKAKLAGEILGLRAPVQPGDDRMEGSSASSSSPEPSPISQPAAGGENGADVVMS